MNEINYANADKRVYEWHLHPDPNKLKVFLDNKDVFIDTNALMFTHNLIETNRKKTQGKVSAYSGAISAIKSIGKTAYIHDIVVSEFAHSSYNEFFRLHSAKKKKPADKKYRDWLNEERKKYRDSEEGRKDIKAISSEIKQFFPNAYKNIGDKTGFEDEMSTARIGKITSEYEQGGMEFNDCFIAYICRRKNLALLTNDSDFASTTGFPIVTANHKLKELRNKPAFVL